MGGVAGEFEALDFTCQFHHLNEMLLRKNAENDEVQVSAVMYGVLFRCLWQIKAR